MTGINRITLSSNEKIALVTNFATMLTAGISILEIVDSLLEDAKGSQKRMLKVIRDDLIQGKHLHVSLAKFPRVFDKVTVNIIKASEEAGTLDTALRELRENIKKETEFSDRVKSALLYPILIVVVLIGVLLMILIFVIPKISQVFSRLKVPLPLPTRILIFFSDFIVNYTVPILVTVVATSVLFIYLFRSNRRVLMHILFKFPLVSKLVRQIDLVRFTRSLYYLLSAAIPITTALELTRDVVQSKSVSRIIANSIGMVSQGKQLSDGLRSEKKTIPILMVKIIEAGEHSGTLDKSLLDISEYLEYRVAKTLHTLTSLLEPTLLVFVGLIVGGLMLSIIGPIYGLIGQVGGR